MTQSKSPSLAMTADSLRSQIHYDPDSGIFHRIGSDARVGSVWTAHSGGKYLRISIHNFQYPAHRLAWLYVHGAWPKSHIDHINGDSLDNRLANLRDIDPIANAKNAALYKTNKSGHVGVSWHRRVAKWVAHINVSGTQVNLGYFEKLKDAVSIRQAAQVLCGYHQNHGRVKCKS